MEKYDTNEGNGNDNASLEKVCSKAEEREEHDQSNQQLEDEDEKVLFDGKQMSVLLADTLAERLKESFATNVHNLPMLSNPQPVLKRLEEAYLLNVDLLEALCTRRIFSISPPMVSSSKRRKQIIEQFRTFPSTEAIRKAALQKQEAHEHVLEEKKQEVDAIQPVVEKYDEKGDENRSYKNNHHQRTQEDVDLIRQDVLRLENKLEKSKLYLQDFKKRLQGLSVASKLYQMANEVTSSTSETSPHFYQDTMTALAMGSSSLEQSEEQGHDYLNQQKLRKEQPQDDTEAEDDALDETFLVDLSTLASNTVDRRKRAKMTLEERFAYDMAQEQQQIKELQQQQVSNVERENMSLPGTSSTPANISDLQNGPHRLLMVQDSPPHSLK